MPVGPHIGLDQRQGPSRPPPPAAGPRGRGPVTSSVTPCSTCRRVFISRKKNPLASTRYSTVPDPRVADRAAPRRRPRPTSAGGRPRAPGRPAPPPPPSGAGAAPSTPGRSRCRTVPWPSPITWTSTWRGASRYRSRKTSSDPNAAAASRWAAATASTSSSARADETHAAAAAAGGRLDEEGVARRPPRRPAARRHPPGRHHGARAGPARRPRPPAPWPGPCAPSRAWPRATARPRRCPRPHRPRAGRGSRRGSRSPGCSASAPASSAAPPVRRATGRSRPSDVPGKQHRGIGLPDMGARRVVRRVDGDGLAAGVMCAADETAGDLAPVGHQADAGSSVPHHTEDRRAPYRRRVHRRQRDGEHGTRVPWIDDPVVPQPPRGVLRRRLLLDLRSRWPGAAPRRRPRRRRGRPRRPRCAAQWRARPPAAWGP